MKKEVYLTINKQEMQDISKRRARKEKRDMNTTLNTKTLRKMNNNQEINRRTRPATGTRKKEDVTTVFARQV